MGAKKEGMAVKTDDEDIRDVRLFMNVGGNGDYYLSLIDMKTKLSLDFRAATSGGNCPTDVKIAIANLYRVLKANSLNEHPLNDK